jgi:hypothetical protein
MQSNKAPEKNFPATRMTLHRNFLIIAMSLALNAQADEYVDKADANDDGKVTLYELRAAYYADEDFNRRIEESFAKYDTNEDGIISPMEMREKRALEQQQAAANNRPPGVDYPDPDEGVALLSVVPATEENKAAVSLEIPGTSATAASTPATAATSSARSAAPSTAGSGARVATPNQPRLSRSETMLLELDDDRNGILTKSELVNNGEQWFSDSAYKSADRNDDGNLGADELEQLIQIQERRRRR